MKKHIKLILLIINIFVLFITCSFIFKQPTFSIQFIDVGQGDSALIECDNHYMLIDGGNVTAKDKVYDVLKEKGVQQLDILAISHMHSDHIGGLPKAMTYLSNIDLVIANTEEIDNKHQESNTEETDKKYQEQLKHELTVHHKEIVVPKVGQKYRLGKAKVEVVDVAATKENDSLVLLITFGETSFLFTGDIEGDGQNRLIQKYSSEKDSLKKITLMKMPHHGSYPREGTLYRFLRTFMADYVVISVGDKNRYGHPDKETIDLLNSKTYKPKLYRTDRDGDILVKSNGKTIEVTTSK